MAEVQCGWKDKVDSGKDYKLRWIGVDFGKDDKLHWIGACSSQKLLSPDFTALRALTFQSPVSQQKALTNHALLPPASQQVEICHSIQ